MPCSRLRAQICRGSLSATQRGPWGRRLACRPSSRVWARPSASSLRASRSIDGPSPRRSDGENRATRCTALLAILLELCARPVATLTIAIGMRKDFDVPVLQDGCRSVSPGACQSTAMRKEDGSSVGRRGRASVGTSSVSRYAGICPRQICFMAHGPPKSVLPVVRPQWRPTRSPP